MSSTRDASPSFYGYLLGLFQSERANMLRMSEINEVDHNTVSLIKIAGLSQALHAFFHNHNHIYCKGMIKDLGTGAAHPEKRVLNLVD